MQVQRSMKYIEETRAKTDRCNICGRVRELTFDHVPPKAMLLNPNVYASTLLDEIPSPNKYMKRFQNGIKYRSICQECNNERLGRNDKDFAKFSEFVGRELITPKEGNTIIVTTKINRVVRAVCGHFLAMKTDFDRKTLPDKQMREILFRSDKRLERISLYCWFYTYTTVYNVRDAVVISKDIRGAHPKGMIGVMASFPLAYMISTKREMDCGLDNLSQYTTKNIDEEIDITLHLDTSKYPGTKTIRNFYWPFNFTKGPFCAGAVLGGKEFVEGSRFGVRD